MAALNVFRASLSRKISLKYNTLRSAHHLATARYAQTVLNLPETTVTTLDNGLKVATSQNDSPTSTVGVFIDSGSVNESSEKNGVANFFEHLAFKGTRQKSQQDLENQIRDMGAEFHANTGREQTSFYAKCLSSDVPKALEILAEVVQNTDLNDAQIEPQRKAILNELEEIQATNLQLVTHDFLHHTAYQGTPLEKSVYGPTESIKSITKSDIVDYVKNNFVASRIVLAGNGNIKHDDLVKLAQQQFSALGNRTAQPTPPLTHRFTGSEVRVRDDWYPFAHVAIAVDTCGSDSEDNIALALAKAAVGRWDKTSPSSADTTNELVQNIYQEKRCHSFETFHTSYKKTGLWGCYFVMDGMVLDDFLFNLQNEWKKLCVTVTDSELDIAKNKLRSDLLERLNNTTLNCVDIAQQVLNTGACKTFAEVENEIESVSVKRLRDVCTKYIYDRCPAIAAVGPVEALPDYTRIRANMYWLRL